jgi:hypothetical protein
MIETAAAVWVRALGENQVGVGQGLPFSRLLLPVSFPAFRLRRGRRGCHAVGCPRGKKQSGSRNQKREPPCRSVPETGRLGAGR